MAMPPLFACQYCTTPGAFIFCLHCGARLCITCDFALHGPGATAAAGLHVRARLCDGCGAAHAELMRFDESGAALCGVCAAGRLVAPAAGTLVTQYTGCPPLPDMVHLLSGEPPQPREAFKASWLEETRLKLEGTVDPLLILRSRL